MEYIYAALLLDAVGKEINEENLENVIKAAGKEPDKATIKMVVDSLKGVDIKEIIKNAQNMQVQVAQTTQQPQQEAKKEEKKEEKSSEEASAGLASLFG